METTQTYDEIGRRYSRHRRPDPRIAAQIERALGDARRVVDVGSGTGSYECAERDVVAVEPSAVMVAQRPAGAAPVVRADAGELPFPDHAFDASMGVFTVHHWPDLGRGLAEMARVAPRRVLLVSDPDLHERFWLLRDYIPAAGEIVAGGPSVDDVVRALGGGRVEPVLVPHDCVDGFACAYWRRPEAYLDPDVRACISCLAQADQDAVAEGVARLADDLRTGRWHARHHDLLELDAIDPGYRLVVSDEGAVGAPRVAYGMIRTC